MILALFCISCAIFVYAVLALVLDTSKEDKVRERLLQLGTEEDYNTLYESIVKGNKRKKHEKAKATLKISRQFEDMLAMSGVKLNANEFIYGWVGLTVVPVLVLFFAGANIISILAGGIIGFALPPLLVRRARNKRLQMFSRQLGESLAIMSNCLRSGFSFNQAMESIATDMQPPISTEFARVLREMKFGVTLETALEHMSNRVKSEELELLISAVLTSSQIGANLVDILDVCMVTIRDRISIKNEIRVLSSQGRVSGLILAALPIVVTLILMLLNPTYILSFFETDIGKILIGVGVGMEFIGFLVMRKMVNIKY